MEQAGMMKAGSSLVIAKDKIPQNDFRCFTTEAFRVVVANIDGRYFAVENRCSHAEGSFERGRLRGPIIICPHHGAQFDMRDGSCKAGPADQPIARFPVHVHQGQIEVSFPSVGSSAI